MLRESFRAVRLMEEYVAGEDLVVLLGPVSEPLRVLLAGRPNVAGRLLEPWRSVAGSGPAGGGAAGPAGHRPGSLRLAARSSRATSTECRSPCR